jgi:hypothetical protein
MATWIDPAVRLDPREEPRVSGKVTYTSTIRDGRRELRITTNFVWVYAFEGTDQPIVVIHDEIQWEFPSTKGLRADDHGMWIGDTKSYAAAGADRLGELVEGALQRRSALRPVLRGRFEPVDCRVPHGQEGRLPRFNRREVGQFDTDPVPARQDVQDLEVAGDGDAPGTHGHTLTETAGDAGTSEGGPRN